VSKDIKRVELRYSKAMEDANRLRTVADDLRRQRDVMSSAVQTIADGAWTGTAATSFAQQMEEKQRRIARCALNAELYAEGIERTAKLIREALGSK
jgi:hypothetical protein